MFMIMLYRLGYPNVYFLMHIKYVTVVLMSAVKLLLNLG